MRSAEERRSGHQRVLEARSPATSADRFRVLALDELRPVRLETARNPSAPADVLELLAGDADSSVRWYLLHNLEAPGAALERMAAMEAAEYGGRVLSIRGEIVHHPNVPPELRRELLALGACKTCPDDPYCSWRLSFGRGHR